MRLLSKISYFGNLFGKFNKFAIDWLKVKDLFCSPPQSIANLLNFPNRFQKYEIFDSNRIAPVHTI